MDQLCRMFKLTERATYYFLRTNVSRLGAFLPTKLEKLLGRFWGSCTYLRLKKPA